MAALDISSIVQQIVGQAAGDNDLMKGLQENPAKALEGMTGIDIPDEQIDAVVEKMGGIEGLVADFTKSEGGGIEGVISGIENAVASELTDSIGQQAGGILGGLFGSK